MNEILLESQKSVESNSWVVNENTEHCINDEEGDLRIHGQLKPLEREQKKHKHERFIFFFSFIKYI